jgi:hypothetical protein
MIYCNFIQGNNTLNRIWSSLLQRSSNKDSYKIYIAFSEFYCIFYVFYKFNQILWNLKQFRKEIIGAQQLAGFGPRPRLDGAAQQPIRPSRPGLSA